MHLYIDILLTEGGQGYMFIFSMLCYISAHIYICLCVYMYNPGDFIDQLLVRLNQRCLRSRF